MDLLLWTYSKRKAQHAAEAHSSGVWQEHAAGAWSSRGKALHAARATLGQNMLTLKLTSAECLHRVLVV